MTSTKVTQIHDDGRVDVEGVLSGQKETLKADTVILAGGMRTTSGCDGSVSAQVISIGDSRAVGKIESAIYEGYFTAREL